MHCCQSCLLHLPLKGLKKPGFLTPKTFKDCFKAHFKLYDYLKVYFEFTIVEKENAMLFFNLFSIQHCIVIVYEQKSTKR